MYQNYVHELGEPLTLERFTQLVGADVFEDNPLELSDGEIMDMVRPDHTDEHDGEDDSVDSED